MNVGRGSQISETSQEPTGGYRKLKFGHSLELDRMNGPAGRLHVRLQDVHDQAVLLDQRFPLESRPNDQQVPVIFGAGQIRSFHFGAG